MSARNLQRVARDLRDKLAQIINTRVADPRLRGVSIVEVRPSPDLTFARVFYRTIGDPEQAAKALRKAKPFIRRCLAENLALRRVPELDLRHDPVQDTSERMDQIFREISDEQDVKRDAALAQAEPDAEAEPDTQADSDGEADPDETEDEAKELP